MAVKVRSLEIKTKKEVTHKPGVTVKEILDEAKVTVPNGGTVTVNKAVAGLNAVVPDNAVVVVTPPVDNGV